MRIVCPQCGYSRDIPSDKIPAHSSIATCPKCQFRFRFRGPSPAPAQDAGPGFAPGYGADEPVYPPRPSRTALDREPLETPPAPPFEPRLPRAPRAASGEREGAGHVPSWPQARWLPDPEPGHGEETQQISERLYRRVRRPSVEEAQDAGPGQEPQAPGVGEHAREERPGEPMRPSPAALAARERADALASQAQPGHRPPPPAAPLDFPDEAPAPWERMEFGRQPAGPAEGGEAPGPVIEGPAAHARAFEEETRPEPGVPGREEAASLPEGDAPEEDQPAQAQAGDDSVRDIWARLQAMGSDPKAAAKPSRQQEDGEPRPARPFHPDTVAPWEQLEHYGVVPAFLNTARNVLLKPGDFFDQLPPASGKLRPLLFAMAVSVMAMLAGVVWNYFGLGPNLAELGRTDGFQGLGSGAIGGLALLGLAPLALIAFVFLDSSLTHLLLGLLRSAARPFEETFRTVCYAGTPWLLAALPMPYSYLIPVVLIWHMTLQAIGLKKLHRAGYPQILASVLVKWSLYFMASFAVLHVLITRR